MRAIKSEPTLYALAPLKRSGADEATVHAEEAALQPLGRLGKADEVAALAYFLASDDAAFITGSLQVIDGGYTAR